MFISQRLNKSGTIENKFGKGHAMLFDNKGDPWITVGPDYWFTIILYLFVFTMSFILINILRYAPENFWYAKYIGISVMLITICKNIS